MKRFAKVIIGCAAALLVLSLFVWVRSWPLERSIAVLQGWMAALGLWGPVVFVVLYVVATLLLLPAWALTVAAGALFGLLEGTLLVSLISTTGAALALVIARYFARDTIAKRLAHYPTFEAIDQAIGAGGWKIVALLRLSPPEVAPLDDHNRTLVAHVHPPDWQNPQPSGRYNLVVIGGGTAGLVTAAGAAGLGARVALIERKLLGGDCLNAGCVPSKALLRAARAAAAVRDAGAFGVDVPAGVRVHFPAVMERMRRLRAHLSTHDSARRFRDLGVDVFLGHACFTGPDTLAVDGQTLRFAKAVIATGSRASAPSIPGIPEVGYLTNETVFSLTELPTRLAVIGAGPIGCELAQAFARFGSEVFLIEALHGILPNDDPEAAEIVKQAMVRDGLHVLCCGQDLQISRTDGGKRLRVDSHGEHYDIVVDDILVGVGRAPNVEGLGLEAAGITYEKTGVTVNERLQTTNPRIYAAGDICSPYKFTHTADAMARLVIQNALFLGRAKASALTIPWCTYTDPEIAHVGLYEKQAEDKGIPVQTFVQPLAEVDRAVLDGDTEGFVKIHVRKGTDRILGATIVAPHAGDLLSEVTLAMVGRLGLKTLARTIHPYPTQAEALKKAGDAYNRTRLTPFVKSLLTAWLGWTR